MALAHNGDAIYVEVHGAGPAVILFNANPRPPEHPARDQLLALRDEMIAHLADRFTVVLPAYPETPKIGTLTPAAVTHDLLAIADEAGADTFGFWGHSWGAVIGLQLAIASDRVTALALSGFPPIDGPYRAMLDSVRALSGQGYIDGLDVPAEIQAEYRQFVTYYEGLQDFDDRGAQAALTVPRLYFVGSDDVLPLGREVITRFGVTARHQRPELERLGWDVQIVPGHDHTSLINAGAIVPVLSPFFERTLGPPPRARTSGGTSNP